MPRLAPLAASLAILLFAQRVEATPVFFNIDTCAVGDCSAFDASGGGTIVAELDVLNGNDLLITLRNRLNADASGDQPYVANVKFQYDGPLAGVTIDNFSVLSGTVAAPSLRVGTSYFGFAFPDYGKRENRFQAGRPTEVVQMVMGTTGPVDLSRFVLGLAKIGGAGEDGAGGPITLTGTPSSRASVPEPTSLALVGLGLVVFHLRRQRS